MTTESLKLLFEKTCEILEKINLTMEEFLNMDQIVRFDYIFSGYYNQLTMEEREYLMSSIITFNHIDHVGIYK